MPEGSQATCREKRESTLSVTGRARRNQILVASRTLGVLRPVWPAYGGGHQSKTLNNAPTHSRHRSRCAKGSLLEVINIKGAGFRNSDVGGALDDKCSQG